MRDDQGDRAIPKSSDGRGGFTPRERRRADFTAAEHAQVAGWRKIRMGWAAIAANFGCDVHTVRKAFDPTYQPVTYRVRLAGSEA